MSAKTKIVVLRMKELIYTGIFVALGILLIILLIVMFFPGKDNSETSSNTPETDIQKDSQTGQDTSSDNTNNADTQTSGSASTAGTTVVLSSNAYIPGIYTTELILNDQAIDVEVIVNQESITSLRLVNLSESVTTMYPLLEPTFENICNHVYEKQSLDGITYEAENKYTSLVLLEAIRSSLEKAQETVSSPE